MDTTRNEHWGLMLSREAQNEQASITLLAFFPQSFLSLTSSWLSQVFQTERIPHLLSSWNNLSSWIWLAATSPALCWDIFSTTFLIALHKLQRPLYLQAQKYSRHSKLWVFSKAQANLKNVYFSLLYRTRKCLIAQTDILFIHRHNLFQCYLVHSELLNNFFCVDYLF